MLYAEITSTVKKSEDTLSQYSTVPSQLQLTEATDQLKVPIRTSYDRNFGGISQLVIGRKFKSIIVKAGL